MGVEASCGAAVGVGVGNRARVRINLHVFVFLGGEGRSMSIYRVIPNLELLPNGESRPDPFIKSDRHAPQRGHGIRLGGSGCGVSPVKMGSIGSSGSGVTRDTASFGCGVVGVRDRGWSYGWEKAGGDGRGVSWSLKGLASRTVVDAGSPCVGGEGGVELEVWGVRPESGGAGGQDVGVGRGVELRPRGGVGGGPLPLGCRIVPSVKG